MEAAKQAMKDEMNAKLLLAVSYFLNAGVWLSDFSLAVKVVLAIIAGATTVMAFFNQYKTFQKNYKTIWVVVTITKVMTALQPKKNRHRGVSINKSKKEQ